MNILTYLLQSAIKKYCMKKTPGNILIVLFITPLLVYCFQTGKNFNH